MTQRRNKPRQSHPADGVGFNASFERIFGSTVLNLAVIALVYFAGYIALGLAQDRRIHIPPAGTVALLAAAVLVIAAVYGFFESRRPRAILDASGIWVRDNWGRLRLMAWHSIRRIDVENRPGARVLVFYTDERPGDLVLPLILQNPAGLRAAAARFAGEDHPLVSTLDAVMESGG